MARTKSTMLELGTQAPNFNLPSTQSNTVSLADFQNHKGLLVVFMCNHCPYVIHLREALAKFARDYQNKGIAVVGINANDADNYPADSFDKMKEEVTTAGYTFPYLYDEDQSVAKAYQAACTPDFFMFDDKQKLYYRGQFDDSRPCSEAAVTGADLRAATDTLLARKMSPAEQKPSLGCNIKWKEGNAPEYFV